MDPKEYTLESLKGESVRRLPGTLKGSPFIISDCEDSKIVLLDDLNTVTVTGCSDCTLIIGPTKGR